MKIQNITDIDKFFKVVDSCEGKVELVTGEGDKLVKTPTYYAFKLFKESDIFSAFYSCVFFYTLFLLTPSLLLLGKLCHFSVVCFNNILLRIRNLWCRNHGFHNCSCCSICILLRYWHLSCSCLPDHWMSIDIVLKQNVYLLDRILLGFQSCNLIFDNVYSLRCEFCNLNLDCRCHLLINVFSEHCLVKYCRAYNCHNKGYHSTER